MEIIKYQKGKSVWMQKTSKEDSYPRLNGDLDVDVVVIGAGIAGLSSAYFLKQSGLNVAVLERHTVGSGTTGHTTGKVTSQHNLIYEKLRERLGRKRAHAYAEANQTAVEEIRRIIAKEKIECDWRDEDNYVFCEDPDQVKELKKEAETAKSLGLPAHFQKETPLPFEIAGAVRFTDQGTFHARKYVLGLAKAVNGKGSYVFEHTEAKAVHDGENVRVETSRGTVTAKSAIMATLVPYTLSAHTAYGLVEYPLSSYIVATKTDTDLSGMYISAGNPTHSLLPVSVEGEKFLLVGGYSHIPGSGLAKRHFQQLTKYARERFGAKPTKFKWLAWDYLSYDDIPLVGKLYPWSKNVYTATGFMKWGMTNGTAAGMILADLINGKNNPWASAYDSTRGSTIQSIPRFLAKLPTLIG